ncbi:MAG: cupin domain-containing protein [Nitrosotalea sp.]
MKKENFNKIKLDKSLLAGKRNYFLGDVILHDISKNIGVRDQKVYYAAFKNGARTKMHYHEGSQILVVTHGTGVLVTYRKNKSQGKQVKITQDKKSALKSGDMVYIPRDTFHWHGAIKGKNFGHVAFNGFSPKRKEAKTIWYDSDFKSHATKIQ